MWAGSAFQQSSGGGGKSSVATDTEWTNAETQLLIKAVAAGTQKRWVEGTPRPQTYITSGGGGGPPCLTHRWEVITGFINTHSSGGTTKVEKQVIAKVKSLQKMQSGDWEAENKMAFTKFAKNHLTKGQVEAPPTQRYGKCAVYGANYGRILVIIIV